MPGHLVRAQITGLDGIGEELTFDGTALVVNRRGIQIQLLLDGILTWVYRAHVRVVSTPVQPEKT
jgi:hypothetical protein